MATDYNCNMIVNKVVSQQCFSVLFCFCFIVFEYLHLPMTMALTFAANKNLFSKTGLLTHLNAQSYCDRSERRDNPVW